MTRSIALSLLLALLVGGCSLSAVTPTPTISVTITSVPLTLTPQGPTAIPDSALLFDGQDDYIRVEDDPSLDLPSSFTISAWIYLAGYTEWASIVTKGDKPNISNYAVHQSGPFDPIYKTEYGKLRFSGCTDLTAPLPESATTLSPGRWHFVAVTYDGIQIQFYLNGKPDGSHNVSAPLCTNDAPLYIGVDFPLTTEYWHGAIDEIRIWSSALSEVQIRELTNGSQLPLETALVGYWAFDEGSGSIAHDRSGHGNDGTLMGDPVWISPGAPIQ